MKQTINAFDFRRAFNDHDRENFSYDGLNILFDYLEDLEQDCGEEYELDVIALCCEFTEATAKDIASNYGIEIDEDSPETAFMQVVDYLNYHTSVCGYDEDKDLIVYQDF